MHVCIGLIPQGVVHYFLTHPSPPPLFPPVPFVAPPIRYATKNRTGFSLALPAASRRSLELLLANQLGVEVTVEACLGKKVTREGSGTRVQACLPPRVPLSVRWAELQEVPAEEVLSAKPLSVTVDQWHCLRCAGISRLHRYCSVEGVAHV